MKNRLLLLLICFSNFYFYSIGQNNAQVNSKDLKVIGIEAQNAVLRGKEKFPYDESYLLADDQSNDENVKERHGDMHRLFFPDTKKSDSSMGTFSDLIFFNVYHYKLIRYTNFFDLDGMVTIKLERLWDYSSNWLDWHRSTYSYDENVNIEVQETFTDGIWVLSKRITKYYNSSGNVITWLREDRIEDSWQNSLKDEYTYNEQGKLLTNGYFKWSGNQWSYLENDICTYNPTGDTLTYIKQYNGDNWFKNIYSYNADTTFIQYYQWTNDDWLLRYRATLTRNQNGDPMVKILHQLVNETWVNNEKVNYMYDENNRLVTILNEKWTNKWVNVSKHTHTLDEEGNLIVCLDQLWYSAWINNYKFSYTYDEFGNSISAEHDYWEDNRWRPSSGFLPMYFEHVVREEEPNEFWAVSHYYEASYIQDTYVTVNNVPIETLSIIYPNPARDIIHINLLPNDMTAKLTILSIDGMKVFEVQNYCSGQSLDIAQLPKGIYILSIYGSKGICSHRFIRQ